MKNAPANLPQLDTAGLTDTAAWTDQLAAANDWAAGLAQPFTDAPTFDAQGADPEVDVNAALPADKKFVRAASRRLFRDYRADANAFKHIDPLPKAGQTLHGVISGKYAMWQMTPALIEVTGLKIADLYLATLSYSRQNAEELLGLLDAGQVKRCTLLVNYFFKAQNREIYDALVPELLNRGHRVLSMRTHAKISLYQMARGPRYVVESSANLRSCKNIEQFSLTRCPRLYAFHRSWIEDELFKPRRKETADVDD
jgi:hypothetical protein